MSELSITTTQNVNINFQAASVGDRIVAQLLDMLIKAAYVIVVYYIFFYLIGLNDYMESADNWSQTAVIMLFGLPVIFYSLVQESLMEGQTFGKKIMKIKVIKLDGYQAGFGDYLMRWLFRLIEISIGSGIIGLIAISVSSKNQRLGDMAAGTAVISLKNNININHTILQEIDDDYVPTYPLVIKLSDNDARIIKETFESALKAKDFRLIFKLRQKIESVTGIKSQSDSDSDFMRTVLKDYNYFTRNM
ncbi:putative membrane protein/domain-containing protein [Flavobacterium limnosediminis JC2902]|uniref:Putative membrane protein/domain-containing protein n=1 Tax=Flavobacterium limnosediminis JC2902 TaxID=1341181 RepID=V6SGX3_9FLAO|nr:RDD family protein [Flavobacterium limnosediminis]ESU25831.1 putative membrane protein/domain-containing protein [Flavobacterium limnosediminis JC2902]